MKSFLLILSLASSFVFAETTTLTIEGMHCAGCKKMISAKVCDDAVLKDKIESCKVSILNEKSQTGQIVIISKKDSKVDLTAIKASVKAAGDNYKVINEEIK